MQKRAVQQIKAGAVVGWRGDLEKKAAEVLTAPPNLPLYHIYSFNIFVQYIYRSCHSPVQPSDKATRSLAQAGDKWKPYQTLDEQVEAEAKA